MRWLARLSRKSLYPLYRHPKPVVQSEDVPFTERDGLFSLGMSEIIAGARSVVFRARIVLEFAGGASNAAMVAKLRTAV
jgi:hypothetical protein